MTTMAMTTTVLTLMTMMIDDPYDYDPETDADMDVGCSTIQIADND